ncbi:MAG: hypothetical protein HY716_03255 [Planctomycetes bacterium]|nr:hypothetical protein [Planctomycetota bacterium]
MKAAASESTIETATRAMGLGATLGRLRAVAALTFKEAIRRRIFLVVVIVGIGIVSSAAFFPTVDPSGRLRLIEIWSVRTITFFCSLGAVFLAGFSLPGDFEQRRVYTLVTKPIHKGTLFLGKLLGFTGLLAVFLAIMAVLTLAYIRLVAAVTPEFPALAALPRHPAASLTGEGPHLKSGTSDALAVRSDQPGALVWKFRGLPPRGFDDAAKGVLKLDLERIQGGFALQGEVKLTAVNPADGATHDQTLLVQTNRLTEFQVPSRCISPEGGMDLRISGAGSDLLIAAQRDSITLASRSVNFELNFLRGTLLILMQSMLVLGVTLAASTFVSAPVSILLGITMLLVGSAWSFVTESLEDVDTALQEVRRREAKGKPPPRTPENIPPWLLELSSAVSRVVLQAVPNFERYNLSEWLLTDTAVAWRDLLDAGWAFTPRFALLLALGLTAMAFRDFAT